MTVSGMAAIRLAALISPQSTVKIALTKKGRKLLESSQRLRLTATADFALAHGTRLTVSSGFTLRR